MTQKFVIWSHFLSKPRPWGRGGGVLQLLHTNCFKVQVLLQNKKCFCLRLLLRLFNLDPCAALVHAGPQSCPPSAPVHNEKGLSWCWPRGDVDFVGSRPDKVSGTQSRWGGRQEGGVRRKWSCEQIRHTQPFLIYLTFIELNNPFLLS